MIGAVIQFDRMGRIGRARKKTSTFQPVTEADEWKANVGTERLHCFHESNHHHERALSGFESRRNG
jgi:hypothetical protein